MIGQETFSVRRHRGAGMATCTVGNPINLPLAQRFWNLRLRQFACRCGRDRRGGGGGRNRDGPEGSSVYLPCWSKCLLNMLGFLFSFTSPLFLGLVGWGLINIWGSAQTLCPSVASLSITRTPGWRLRRLTRTADVNVVKQFKDVIMD